MWVRTLALGLGAVACGGHEPMVHRSVCPEEPIDLDEVSALGFSAREAVAVAEAAYAAVAIDWKVSVRGLEESETRVADVLHFSFGEPAGAMWTTPSADPSREFYCGVFDHLRVSVPVVISSESGDVTGQQVVDVVAHADRVMLTSIAGWMSGVVRGRYLQEERERISGQEPEISFAALPGSTDSSDVRVEQSFLVGDLHCYNSVEDPCASFAVSISPMME